MRRKCGWSYIVSRLGAIHRLQKCGGVDRQCDLEVLSHSTQVVLKTSEMAKHIGLVQCGHLT
jgi:hypothetical protein